MRTTKGQIRPTFNVGREAAREAVEKFYGLGRYDDGRQVGDLSDRPGPINYMTSRTA
jgi:hypothetical protein